MPAGNPKVARSANIKKRQSKKRIKKRKEEEEEDDEEYDEEEEKGENTDLRLSSKEGTVADTEKEVPLEQIWLGGQAYAIEELGSAIQAREKQKGPASMSAEDVQWIRELMHQTCHRQLTEAPNEQEKGLLKQVAIKIESVDEEKLREMRVITNERPFDGFENSENVE